MMRLFHLRYLWVAFLPLVLAACAPATRVLERWQGQAPQADAPPPAPDARFRYLRVTLNGRVAWLAGGAQDNWPLPDTAVYYSASGGVLRLKEGRILSYTDPLLQWQTAQDLSLLPAIDAAQALVRHAHASNPGKFVPPPQHHYQPQAGQPPASALVWQQHASSGAWHAYADGHAHTHEAVYGQHCLRADWCISWQPWQLEKRPSP